MIAPPPEHPAAIDQYEADIANGEPWRRAMARARCVHDDRMVADANDFECSIPAVELGR